MSSPKASPAPKRSSKKAAASASKGSYVQQVAEAIKHYGVRGGVSSTKIKQFIEENADHPIQKGVINRAIKKAVETGVITAKAGHANTFHLTPKARKSPSAAGSKSPSAKKKSGVAAKKTKKTPGKKAAAASPKSPSAKSPSAKKSSSTKKSPSTKKAAPKKKSSSTKKAASGTAKKASTKKTAAKKTSSKKKASTKKSA